MTAALSIPNFPAVVDGLLRLSKRYPADSDVRALADALCGAEVVSLPAEGKAPKARAKAKRAPSAPISDPRLAGNTAPHLEIPHTGPRPATAAQAAKARREKMQACGCRLCALALNPPLTFAEAATFGIGAGVSPDHEALVFKTARPGDLKGLVRR